MVTFTDQEKAVILLGTLSITEADSYGIGPNEMEIKFAQFVQRTIKPTQLVYHLYESYIQNPVQAYNQIKNAPLEKKRIIKTFFVFMCTCDGPINEDEQTALVLLDIFCGFPYMSMDEMENEFRKISSI